MSKKPNTAPTPDEFCWNCNDEEKLDVLLKHAICNNGYIASRYHAALLQLDDKVWLKKMVLVLIDMQEKLQNQLIDIARYHGCYSNGIPNGVGK